MRLRNRVMSVGSLFRVKPPTSPAVQSIDIVRRTGAGAVDCTDDVTVEEPLEIRLQGRSLAVVMRTPGQDRELVAGFLVTEGLIRSRADLLDLVPCGPEGEPRENVLEAVTRPGLTVDWARLQRHTFASSSCGVCGKATLESVRGAFSALTPAPPFRVEQVMRWPEVLRSAQAGFTRTGGLHASGLFDRTGRLVAVREDVGRHNALDKIVGWAFLEERLPLSQHGLLVSGRVSFELMQKALAAGIGCVAAISAPSTLAVSLARESGQTLVGFVRGERMNVYAGTLSD